MEASQEVSGMIDELVRESLGQILKTEREKQQLSVRQVADQLRLMPYQIEALEDENFKAFKAVLFAKAYLKNYANLLGIDEQALLELYETKHQAEASLPQVRKVKPVQVPCKKRYIGVIAVIVIVALLWFLNRSDQRAAEVEQNPAIDAAHNQLVKTASGVADQSEVELVSEETPAIAVQQQETAVDVMGAELELVEQQLIDADTVIAETIKEMPAHNLALSFTGECWVEVTDAQGTVLLADLKREGENIELAGEAPFDVLLGYAPAVTLLYNGEQVEINSQSSNQSARLVVGRS